LCLSVPYSNSFPMSSESHTPHQTVFHQVKKMFRHCDTANQRPETPQRSDLRRSKTQPNVIA
jgi:hypothetical protein